MAATAMQRYAETVRLAWQGALEFGALLEAASELERQQQPALAAVLYQTWVKKTPSPYLHAAYFNMGALLANAGDFVGAEEAYRAAIGMASSFWQPRLNLGSLLERAGKPEQAIAEWRLVEQNASLALPENRPLVLMAVNNLGRLLEIQKQFYESLYFLTKSLQIEPDQDEVLHHWVYLRQKQCAWPVYAKVPRVSQAAMERATSALAMISISDDPAAQLAAAQRYVAKKVITDVPKLANSAGYKHKKIRIGYCSSDFSLHPVSMLTVEMFELHDRERFEVYGYCWSPQDGSALRVRVIAAMDHFTRIDTLSDQEAAMKIRADEIDILIDLQGQTAGARPNMLAYRPAPVQITYLGQPATTGFPFIDYVIADKFLIPEESAKYYSEKPLYMPDVYQVSDRKRVAGPKPTRHSCGLPETGFVFCSFNNNYKLTPDMFDVWMSILRRVPGSVLWLLADNQWAEGNLRLEAEARGVDASRLVFAGRVSPENYLARYLIADLFLDSFPFNAGTTANDALFMGLPVLTCSGRSFASRMAGALLTAAGCPDLICFDLKMYEERAVALGGDTLEMAKCKRNVVNAKTRGNLFNTPGFVKTLEGAFLALV